MSRIALVRLFFTTLALTVVAGLARSVAVSPGSTHAESTRTETARLETARPDSTRSQGARPNTARPQWAQGRTTPSGTAERSLPLDGRTRTYRIYDPGGAAPAPVVIVLHGGGGNAANAERMTGFTRIARREGIVAVYPDGTAGRPRGRLLTWNAGHCCAGAMTNRVDDVGFISALIDTLVASGRADATRIYVTGMSNGGMMAHRLGRELSTKLAAIAPVVGAVFGDEAPPRAPVPAFIVVGATDAVVPPDGGPLQVRRLLGGRSAADRNVAPAMAQATYWATHNGCAAPAKTTTPAVETTTWSSCTSGAPVVFHSVTGNGHAWPGGQAGRQGAAQPTTGFDASAEMWAFFSRQRRPAAR